MHRMNPLTFDHLLMLVGSRDNRFIAECQIYLTDTLIEEEEEEEAKLNQTRSLFFGDNSPQEPHHLRTTLCVFGH